MPQLETAAQCDVVVLAAKILACAVPRRVTEEWPEKAATQDVAEETIALVNRNIAIANEIGRCWRVISAY